MTQDATAQAAQAAGLQVTEHRPSRSNSEVDLNLVGDQAPICPFCTRGRVFLTGRKDWRSTILAYCDNPECGDLDDTEAAYGDEVVVHDPAQRIGEGEVEFALRAGQLPLAQDLDQRRWQRDGALAGCGFGRPDLVIAIGALAHVQFAGLEVDIGPAQAAQLG